MDKYSALTVICLALTGKSFARKFKGFALKDESFASTATDNGFAFGLFCFVSTDNFCFAFQRNIRSISILTVQSQKVLLMYF